MKKPQMYASLGVLAILVSFVLFVPLPYSVRCPLELRPRDAARVYVEVPGTLEAVNVHVGQRVEQNEQLARLRNVDLNFDIARLSGDQKEYDVRLASLHRIGRHNPRAKGAIPAVREARDGVVKELKQKIHDQDLLILRAPCAGTVMPPPWRGNPPEIEIQLPPWSGTPLEPRNLGAAMEDGDVFCLIGDPTKMEAILYIGQGDVNFVAKHQRVEIQLDALPFDIFESTIENIAEAESKDVSRRMIALAGGPIPTKRNEGGEDQPQNALYQASVLLDDPEGLFRIGLRGQAKIHTAPRTLGQRIWRMINQFINFSL